MNGVIYFMAVIMDPLNLSLRVIKADFPLISPDRIFCQWSMLVHMMKSRRKQPDS